MMDLQKITSQSGLDSIPEVQPRSQSLTRSQSSKGMTRSQLLARGESSKLLSQPKLSRGQSLYNLSLMPSKLSQDILSDELYDKCQTKDKIWPENFGCNSRDAKKITL